MNIDKDKLNKCLTIVRNDLLAEMQDDTFWKGHLSSSALSTATAVTALAVFDHDKYHTQITNGLNWLSENTNDGGGWGDTVLSHSNLPTTLLCWSAFAFTPNPDQFAEIIERAESWLINNIGSLEPMAIAKAVEDQYGKDKTFSIPILTMCAIAGRLGDTSQAWNLVKPLPFEFAALPHTFFKWLRLSVVSYALPALIAIGQVNFHKSPPKNPITRLLRRLTLKRTLSTLGRIQPPNGGFLEATPLTSFVVMSLVAAGNANHSVVSKGIDFLCNSTLDDGSWPIDTNLATWLTTLSVNALSASNHSSKNLSTQQQNNIKRWLLNQQYRTIHLFTKTPPGGWAWTDLPGGVPDADDTAGALLALAKLDGKDDQSDNAAIAAINWLLGLQNSDGGIPTFCRGWTKLPFDRSAPDLTAHAIAAITVWQDKLPSTISAKVTKAVAGMITYLKKDLRPDGSWIPLWFGDQNAPNQKNPVYGTAKVLSFLAPLTNEHSTSQMLQKAITFLVAAQNKDGSWGSDSSVEETALSIDALAAVAMHIDSDQQPAIFAAIEKAIPWLCDCIIKDQPLSPSPIGLYFASLWYYEKLYPLIFTVAALNRVDKLVKQLAHKKG